MADKARLLANVEHVMRGLLTSLLLSTAVHLCLVATERKHSLVLCKQAQAAMW